jgi:large subunit ribosomal protein L35
MPKLKTRKAISKRMKITKTGKVLRRKPGARHYKAGKSAGRRRKLRGTDLLTGKVAKNIKILMAPGA